MTRLSHELMLFQVYWEKIPESVKDAILLTIYIVTFIAFIVLLFPDDPRY